MRRDRKGPVAVVLPGAGSTGDFVARAFERPLAEAGYALVTWEPEAGRPLVSATLTALDDAARRYDVRVAGGVSLGAALAVRWAAAGSPGTAALDGVLLALPAWSGPPGAAAAASAAAAVEVEARGVEAALRRAAPGGVPWVLAELRAAWPRYGDALPAALRAAAAVPGPSREELRRVRVAAGVVAFVDDPLHPLHVAEQWAADLPRAALERLHLADPARDRAVLGAAALRALRLATGSGPDRARPVTRQERRRG
jgi:hypothetical protein